MVSLSRSGLALLSISRSAAAFVATRTHTKTLTPSSSTTITTFTTSSSSLSSWSNRRRSLLCWTAAGLLSVSFANQKVGAASFCDSSRLEMSSNANNDKDVMTGYLKAADAAALDMELMSTPGFSLEQLMELAGLSVAEAVYQVVPPQSTSTAGERPRILLICGPGNNGGDGLVAARHLVFFGYDCVVVYPKQSSKQHFINLVQQCQDVGIPILTELPSDLVEPTSDNTKQYDAIIDAIFGFSFQGEPREPFATALIQMKQAQERQGIPIISVDVPSGWNVDEGDVTGNGFVPQVLISLTTPKLSSKNFPGRHFVGGRFLPPKLAEKYNVQMPPYPGTSQVMEITNLTGSSSAKARGESSSNWEAEYADYLASKEQTESTEPPSFSASVAKPVKGETSWEHQYAEYCAEKEALLAEKDAKETDKL